LSRGCLACHTLEGAGVEASSPGGPLEGTGLRRTREALVRFLSRGEDPGGSSVHRPEIAWREGDLRHAAAFLASLGARAESVPEATQSNPGHDASRAAMGRDVVLSRGCAACHALPGGEGKPPSRTPLRGRRAGATSCLDPSAPGSIRPYFPLAEADRQAIEELLDRAAPDARLAPFEEGRLLLEERRCTHCHPRDGGTGLVETASVVAALDPALRGMEAALRPPSLSSAGDKFHRDVLLEAIAELRDRAAPDARLAPFEEGRLPLEEKRCTHCHPRDGGTGLVETASAVAALDPALRGMEAALRPPSLSSAGDKFAPDVLRDAIAGRLPRRRPWLEVRMPLFAHTPEEEQALLRHLESHDAIPPRPGVQIPDAAGADEIAAGSLLVGPKGFGCSSCHAVGPQVPAGIALATRGPDLLDTTERLRLPWFLRWLSDPSRIAPGIEMPAIQSAYPGVLGGDRDRQIAALWRALGSKGFSLPARAGVVRELGFRAGEPVVVREVFRAPGPPGGWIPRGLAIGLPSGHGLLYDLDRFALAGTWTGGFARQLTEGKTWYWEAAGDPLSPGLPPVPILGARIEGRILFPAMESAGTGRLESWRRASARGIEIEYRLGLGGRRIVVREGFEALEGGYRRRVAASGFPREARPVIVIGVEADGTRLEAEGGVIVSTTARGPLQVSSGTPGEWRRLEAQPWAANAALFERDLEEVDGASLAVIDWIVAADAPRAGDPAAPSPRASLETGRGERLAPDAFPGFRAVRLDLDEAFMPTAFALGPGGTVYVSSLKGDVLRLRDADGDGLPEETAPFSDPLSAPMGLLADEEGLVVSHKPELLRLTDTDGDGRADLARVIASGWGFTNDYHDWTLGLVRQGGRHVVITGSDYGQKGRNPATTRMRGKLLSISDGGDVEVEGRGIRFAMGIARNRDGEVFFTDNQGEGNTFNELNHARRGRYYGVPSLEDPPGEAPGKGDSRPEPPALVFPHPWTRSVNGIAFLEGGGRFAPYEGHGIGCEYDNRMLVRFTLEKTGETYQGACYPFSRAPSLLGPFACAAGPEGRLYVGDLRDSGWGGGSNIGAVVLLEREGAPPPGILEARAWERGFDLELTAALEARAAADPRSYVLTAYRRIWKGGYATADQDLRTLEVTGVEVKDGGKTVRLEVEPFTAGFIHEIHVRARPPTGDPLWPAVAHYTLNTVPGR
ncbi:MAG TPA: hypothetical protein VMT52_03810, partial [Planctomycetota bacterium]|nr:hypothetical protein [Planctomycetota bacterium]